MHPGSKYGGKPLGGDAGCCVSAFCHAQPPGAQIKERRCGLGHKENSRIQVSVDMDHVLKPGRAS